MDSDNDFDLNVDLNQDFNSTESEETYPTQESQVETFSSPPTEAANSYYSDNNGSDDDVVIISTPKPSQRKRSRTRSHCSNISNPANDTTSNNNSNSNSDSDSTAKRRRSSEKRTDTNLPIVGDELSKADDVLLFQSLLGRKVSIFSSTDDCSNSNGDNTNSNSALVKEKTTIRTKAVSTSKALETIAREDSNECMPSDSDEYQQPKQQRQQQQQRTRNNTAKQQKQQQALTRQLAREAKQQQKRRLADAKKAQKELERRARGAFSSQEIIVRIHNAFVKRTGGSVIQRILTQRFTSVDTVSNWSLQSSETESETTAACIRWFRRLPVPYFYARYILGALTNNSDTCDSQSMSQSQSQQSQSSQQDDSEMSQSQQQDDLIDRLSDPEEMVSAIRNSAFGHLIQWQPAEDASIDVSSLFLTVDINTLLVRVSGEELMKLVHQQKSILPFLNSIWERYFTVPNQQARASDELVVVEFEQQQQQQQQQQMLLRWFPARLILLIEGLQSKLRAIQEAKYKKYINNDSNTRSKTKRATKTKANGDNVDDERVFDLSELDETQITNDIELALLQAQLTFRSTTSVEISNDHRLQSCSLIVKHTATAAESAEYISGISMFLQNEPYKKQLSALDFSNSTSSSTSARTLQAAWLQQLREIPKVSDKVAQTIVKHYPTLRSLVDVYRDPAKPYKEKEKLLQEIQIAYGVQGAQRKLGPVLSARIFHFFCSPDGESDT